MTNKRLICNLAILKKGVEYFCTDFFKLTKIKTGLFFHCIFLRIRRSQAHALILMNAHTQNPTTMRIGVEGNIAGLQLKEHVGNPTSLICSS